VVELEKAAEEVVEAYNRFVDRRRKS